MSAAVLRAATLALALGGIAVQPLHAQALALRPPYAGVYQPQGTDEIGWWREDDESERELARSNLVIRDEALTGYIRQVLCDTVGQDRCNAVRVYVLREPVFNATMSPNGTMRVFSGLLLRVHSEAELGAVLGHEFGHFESRHSLGRFQATRSGTDMLAWATVLANLSPSYDVRRTYQNLQVSVYGNLFRYGRDNEREADRLGIAYLNASRLQPQAASRVWQNIMREAEASARSRGLKKPRFDTIAFTASHPPHAERAGYLAQLAAPGTESRDDGAERYRAAIAPWLAMLLDDQIRLNDFGASDYIIQSLAENGWTAPLWLARGDLYRARGNPRDLVNAADFYARAVALDAGLAEAHRGLGLALMKTGQPSPGQAALRDYLRLRPDAPDKAMIRMMLPREEAAR